MTTSGRPLAVRVYPVVRPSGSIALVTYRELARPAENGSNPATPSRSHCHTPPSAATWVTGWPNQSYRTRVGFPAPSVVVAHAAPARGAVICWVRAGATVRAPYP